MYLRDFLCNYCLFYILYVLDRPETPFPKQQQQHSQSSTNLNAKPSTATATANTNKANLIQQSHSAPSSPSK